ncbi:MAG: glycosyltransferase, partial [Achromobacter piechaudii]
MAVLFSYLAQAVFVLVVLAFGLYVILELRVLLISRKVERRKLAAIDQAVVDIDRTNLPRVSVLLPICNESSVVERLIDAACRLRYPPGALEILILDDSSDITSKLAQARADVHAASGVNVRVIRRQDRKGFKAGNLVHGIQQSTGDFFA